MFAVSPAFESGLDFAVFLFGQGDERCGVVRFLAGLHGFVDARLGNEGLSHSCRCADEGALFRGKPIENGFLLKGIRLERQLFEIHEGNVLAGEHGIALYQNKSRNGAQHNDGVSHLILIPLYRLSVHQRPVCTNHIENAHEIGLVGKKSLP